MVVIVTLMILIWKARPAYRFLELLRYKGRRLRCSILAEVFVALVEVFDLLWRCSHQPVLILVLPNVLGQN